MEKLAADTTKVLDEVALTNGTEDLLTATGSLDTSVASDEQIPAPQQSDESGEEFTEEELKKAEEFKT